MKVAGIVEELRGVTDWSPASFTLEVVEKARRLGMMGRMREAK